MFCKYLIIKAIFYFFVLSDADGYLRKHFFVSLGNTLSLKCYLCVTVALPFRAFGYAQFLPALP